jgi:hypothetical protein
MNPTAAAADHAKRRATDAMRATANAVEAAEAERLAAIQVGVTVADRRSGEVIGQVDARHNTFAIVSWPAPDLEHARTDSRGRRGQVFNLDMLVAVTKEV